MTYEATGRLLLTPVDKQAPARVRRLRELGLGELSEPALDAFAERLARVLDAPYAMVNFIGEEQQFFAGLHTPQPAPPRDRAAEPGTGVVGRHMARERGYCPHVVVRGRALALEDVGDFPRFAGNPVVDELGIRSYLGAPLLDRSGLALGTVCVADVRPRPWGHEGLDTIKSMAAELTGRILRREDEGNADAPL
ncbi:GAF domain-containing protein [Streptomyces sp. p1417]|uniref:GAF domain-containing protein n=1 Tax=Streptomyces typhae TaxID=2681492 RepID=A0A6L6WUH6_9ACTN|nr:GAF domain-containing protein [Streptomyces typhae]MVO85168.1 GAF domain-containing protein [Streptomyces typhae]